MKRLNISWLFQFIVGIIICIPTLIILLRLFEPYSSDFSHLRATVLPEFVWNSISLTFAVGALSLFFGYTCAWLITFCNFPGKTFFRWALILPLAFPAYILAYLYTDWLQFSGPVQNFIRQIGNFGKEDYWFPQIRSWGGAVFIMSLAFYPYIYLLIRTNFLRQSSAALEVSRTLGIGPWNTFLKITLPLSRPALVAGFTLVAMETLADFGAVAYFGIPTLTTGIYRAWTSLNDSNTAAQLSGFLLLIIFVLIIAEYLNRNTRRFQTTEKQVRYPSPYILRGIKKYLAVTICFLPVIFGFILPVMLLGINIIDNFAVISFGSLLPSLKNSFVLASIAAVIAIVLSFFLVSSERFQPTIISKAVNKIAYLGYATPGIIIAVGLLIMLGFFSNLGQSFLFTGSIIALIYCYQVRFLATSLVSVESGYSKIPLSMDSAARSLGHSSFGIFKRIHLHFLWPTLLSAWLLVFIEVTKELTATYVIRPFNFDTLAIRSYQLIIDERIIEASLPALTLVILGIIPVILLSKQFEKSHSPNQNF